MNAGCVRATVSAVAAARTRPPEPSLPRLLDCELLRCKQHLNCGLSAHRWEPLQKLVQCAAGFQVLKQGFYWHAGPGENRLTAHHPGFRCDWWPPGISSPKGILHKVIHVPAKEPWPQHHHRASVIFDTWLCQGVLNGCLAGGGGRWRVVMDGSLKCAGLASLGDAGVMRVFTGGVVALLLNHRLHSGNPPGSGAGRL